MARKKTNQEPDLTEEMERETGTNPPEDELETVDFPNSGSEGSPPRLDPGRAAQARAEIAREKTGGGAPGAPEGDPGAGGGESGGGGPDASPGAPEEASSALRAQTLKAEGIPTLARDDAALREAQASGDPSKAPGQPLQDDPGQLPSREETMANVAILNSPKGDLAPTHPSQNLEVVQPAPEPRKGERYFRILRGVVQGFVAAPAGATRQMIAGSELNLPEGAIERLKRMGSLEEVDQGPQGGA
jgi:hypothetical protein